MSPSLAHPHEFGLSAQSQPVRFRARFVLLPLAKRRLCRALSRPRISAATLWLDIREYSSRRSTTKCGTFIHSIEFLLRALAPSNRWTDRDQRSRLQGTFKRVVAATRASIIARHWALRSGSVGLGQPGKRIKQPNFADFIAGCRQDRAHENSAATSPDASFDEVSTNPLFQNGATTVFQILQTFGTNHRHRFQRSISTLSPKRRTK